MLILITWLVQSLPGSFTPKERDLCSNSLDFYISYMEFFCVGHLSPLSHLCIQPIISLNLCGLWIFILYFGLKFIPSVFILLSELFQLWKLFQLALLFVCLTYSHHCMCMRVCLCVFNTSSFSGAPRYSKFILCIFCPRHRISHFYKEIQFFLQKNGIRNQDMNARCGYWSHCFQGMSAVKVKKGMCE